MDQATCAVYLLQIVAEVRRTFISIVQVTDQWTDPAQLWRAADIVYLHPLGDENRENLKQLILRDWLWLFLDYIKMVDFYQYRLFFFTQLCSNSL